MKKFTLAVIAAASMVGTAQAEEIKILKDISIGGGIATYAYLLMNRDNFEACQKVSRAGGESVFDEELTGFTFSYSMAECELKQGTAPYGLNVRVTPTLVAGAWQASSGSGASGLNEFSFIPRVNYIFPVKDVKVDVGVGTGVGLISATNIGDRRKSTKFQFTNEVSVGISDAKETFRFAVVYRHLSNCDIAMPNNGVDFKGVTFTMKL